MKRSLMSRCRLNSGYPRIERRELDSGSIYLIGHCVTPNGIVGVHGFIPVRSKPWLHLVCVVGGIEFEERIVDAYYTDRGIQRVAHNFLKRMEHLRWRGQ